MAEAASSNSDSWESLSSESDYMGSLSSEDDESPLANLVYQFKISLNYIKPPIWRRILMASDSKFAELHSAVVASMGWLGSHLHTFHSRNLEIAPLNAKNDNEVILNLISLVSGESQKRKVDETRVKLYEHFEKPEDSILYLYDLDDNWEHLITLEAILPYDGDDDNTPIPACLDGQRACPPDDCGGAEAYETLLEVLSDRSNPEHGDMKAWLNLKDNETYDPEAFDIRSVRF